MISDDNLLQDMDATCQQLLTSLLEEFNALSKREYQSLLTIAQTKQLLVEKLDTIDEQVRARNHIQQHPHWPASRNMLQQCQQQNASNGRLLARSFQINREALNILTGQGKTSNTTYNPSGIQQSTASTMSNVTA